MIKLIGAILVMLAASAFGFRQARRLAARPVQIRLWLSALQQMETEIVYGATPLPEACVRIGARVAPPVGRVFRAAGNGTERRETGTFAASWREALDGSRASLVMKESERDILLRLGSVLGLSDRDDQSKHLRLAVTQLQYEENAALSDQQRYEKMWKTLGVLTGALIVVLLI